MHDKMGKDFRCNLYDVSGYPGLGRDRPDCVVVKGRRDCWVYEFKPRGYSGENKLPGYVQRVTAYREGRMHRDEDAADALGGHAFQALVEANCRVEPAKDKRQDVLEFRSSTEPYDRCSQRYVCEQ